MRPLVWNPPVELSAKEEKVAKRIRKAKLFVFLRQIRHELCPQSPRSRSYVRNSCWRNFSPDQPTICLICQYLLLDWLSSGSAIAPYRFSSIISSLLSKLISNG